MISPTIHAELIATAKVVIAQAAEAHPACCDWCVICTRCSEEANRPYACLTRRMADVMAQILRTIETEVEEHP